MTRAYDRLAPIFDDFALVVAVFAPAVAARYRIFQSETLLPGAEAIRLPTLAPLSSPSMTLATLGGLLQGAFR